MPPRRGRRWPGSPCTPLEGAQAICIAAEETGVPVLMQVGASAFKHTGRDALASVAVRRPAPPQRRSVCTRITREILMRSVHVWNLGTYR